MNVLLPTDFSENSWNAVKYALNFYENDSCNFYLLHINTVNNMVVNDTPYMIDQNVIEEVYTKPAKTQLRAFLKRILKQFPDTKNHHRFYTLTDHGFFIESLRKHIREKQIDMIVMGTKGATGLKELIVGSNTGDVITKVQCTTLVVPENATYTPIKEIAFPTDFSLFYNIKTLVPISKILYATKAALRILHISKDKINLNSDQKRNKELFEDFFTECDYSFHYLTNTNIEDAVQCFVESRDIDMITMVAKNLNYFQQILFHSKVEKISYHTDVPFLVLHD